MDPNQIPNNTTPQPFPVVAPSGPVVPPPPPPVETPKTSNKKLLLILSVILVAVLIVVAAGTYYLSITSKNSAKTQEFEAISSPTPTVTAVPSEPEVTSKDTSDNSLDQDSKVLDQNINNLSNDATSIDNSFSDQQTDLN